MRATQADLKVDHTLADAIPGRTDMGLRKWRSEKAKLGVPVDCWTWTIRQHYPKTKPSGATPVTRQGNGAGHAKLKPVDQSPKARVRYGVLRALKYVLSSACEDSKVGQVWAESVEKTKMIDMPAFEQAHRATPGRKSTNGHPLSSAIKIYDEGGLAGLLIDTVASSSRDQAKQLKSVLNSESRQLSFASVAQVLEMLPRQVGIELAWMKGRLPPDVPSTLKGDGRVRLCESCHWERVAPRARLFDTSQPRENHRNTLLTTLSRLSVAAHLILNFGEML